MRWTLKQTILVRRMGRSILLLDLLEKTGHKKKHIRNLVYGCYYPDLKNAFNFLPV